MYHLTIQLELVEVSIIDTEIVVFVSTDLSLINPQLTPKVFMSTGTQTTLQCKEGTKDQATWTPDAAQELEVMVRAVEPQWFKKQTCTNM